VRKSTRANKIRAYIEAHPDDSSGSIAKRFKVHVSRIYQLRKQVKGPEVTKIKLTPVPSKDLKKATQEAYERMVESMSNPKVEEPKDVDAILDERAREYGKFIEGAEIMQMTKRLIHNYIDQRGTAMAFDQLEAIDMIIHKLGRMINGNPDKADHWLDIAGYAKLVADRLNGNVR
jgi:hypothetical protein